MPYHRRQRHRQRESGHRGREAFMQLQYAQMTILNFGILGVPAAPILGWPHISVATLRKSFL